MRQATFLWKNERGIYFFRARIPKQYSAYFNGSEIKKSLKTDSYRNAVKLARAYRVELDKTMEKLEKGTYSALEVTLTTKTDIILPNGEKRPVESKIGRNLASLDDLPALREHFTKLHGNEVERQERRAREQALFEAQLSAISATSASTTQLAKVTEPSLQYSEVVKTYLDEGEAANRWTPKSRDQVESSLNLFKEFVGDLPIRSIDKKVTREFKAQYLKIPSNHKKKLEYRDKSIAELLSMAIPQEDLIDSGTVLSNMTRISGLFSWAKNHAYIDANPIEGIKPKKKKRKASEARDVFDKADLTSIFESEEYKNGFLHGSDVWKYWIPIIALYTGMRLEEICRLRVDCFEVVGDIATIEIKPDGEWYGKTDAALRSFALHPKLIELGLLKLVEHQRSAGKQRLFDELKEGRDGYGARVSKWFARYCDRCCVIDKKKTFHSFRHTFLNELKQRGVSLEIREAIAGHENKSQSESRYGKAYIAKITFEAIQQADFDLDHPFA